MNSTVPKKGNRFRSFLAASAIGLIIVAVAGLALYPRWQAQQWKQELLTTPNLLEAHRLLQKMLRADNPHAHAVLAELAEDRDSVVFDPEHRVLLMTSPETRQVYSVTRGSFFRVYAKLVQPRIVENVPEALTIAATNEVNGSTYLFFFRYDHQGYTSVHSSNELKQFEENGYWNEYVARHGDSVPEIPKSWSEAEK